MKQVTYLLNAVWMVMTLNTKEPLLGCVGMFLRKIRSVELIVVGGGRAL